MIIHESAEDYLETILILRERLGQVRSIDIVNELGYSKPSISVAMKRLRENDYVDMDSEGYITLKPNGLSIAQRVYDRHRLLTDFLVRLGVNETIAAEDACKMEHGMSEETFTALQNHALHLKSEEKNSASAR